ncbi:MAG: DUF3592 domain-containing protein [Candidatus Hodarchaeales archaeon]|jgi:hypothetical protein
MSRKKFMRDKANLQRQTDQKSVDIIKITLSYFVIANIIVGNIMDKIISYSFGGILFGSIGLLTVYLFIKRYRKRKERVRDEQEYIRVEGLITSSSVSRPIFIQHKTTIRFRYEVLEAVDGLGARVLFSSNKKIFSSRSSADNLVAKYPKGTTVDVYYDPKDPEKAILEQNKSNTLKNSWLIPGLFFCIISGIFWMDYIVAFPASIPENFLELFPGIVFIFGGLLFGEGLLGVILAFLLCVVIGFVNSQYKFQAYKKTIMHISISGAVLFIGGIMEIVLGSLLINSPPIGELPSVFVVTLGALIFSMIIALFLFLPLFGISFVLLIFLLEAIKYYSSN